MGSVKAFKGHVLQLRRALRAAVPASGRYLGVNSQSQVIETLDSPSDAWIFHTHDGAVRHARWIGEVHGSTRTWFAWTTTATAKVGLGSSALSKQITPAEER